MKYETDKGYLVCKETKNGVIDDLKIEGKTLVNLSQSTVIGLGTSDLIETRITPGKPHTIVVFGNYEGHLNFLGFADSSHLENRFLSVNGYTVILDTFSYSNSTVNKVKFRKQNIITDGEVKILILEGDHTQNPPSYFEGLMSVGEDVDKIEVLSCNENLVPSDWDYKFQCFGDMKVNQIDTRTFEIVNTNTVDGIVISKNFINKFCYNNKVVFDFYSNQIGQFYVLDYGVSGEGYKPVQGAMVIEGGRNVFVVDVSNASGRLAFRFNNNTKNSTMIISDFSIKTSENSNNVNHQSDKKQILFYNSNGELEPIQELHEWDSIEKHSDNKWYYHKRSGKVVLNGSEDENWAMENNTNTIRFVLSNKLINPIIKQNNLDIVCDKFNAKYNFNLDEEGIFINTRDNSANSVYIRLLKTKLSTQDVTGFKQWLQANNVTVVYQLAEEEVYELAPLHLDSYANETLILCNSGVISPKMEFSITSHINELIKSQGERINLLEEKVYKYMIVQNRIQLTSMYNSDSVAFKVNHTTYSEDVTEYNEDLYNLILENILVGKDNYNIDKMSNLILDYVSWNQITWEQYDILISLMEMQHRPLIEEDGDIDAIN